MRIKVNSIITLENRSQYVVLNQTNYQGKQYFLVMGLDERREVIPSNVAIFEEIFDGIATTYVEKVNDSNLMFILTQELKAQL